MLNNKILPALLLVLICSCSACVPLRQTAPGDEVLLEQKLVGLLTQATLLMREGDERSYQDSLATLFIAKELAPEDSRVLDAIGCVEWRRGNDQIAEHYFRAALELNPYYDRAYAHLALVAEKRGDIGIARELLQTAVSMNPLNYRSRSNYAQLLISHARGSSERKLGELEGRKAANIAIPPSF